MGADAHDNGGSCGPGRGAAPKDTQSGPASKDGECVEAGHSGPAFLYSSGDRNPGTLCHLAPSLPPALQTAQLGNSGGSLLLALSSSEKPWSHVSKDPMTSGRSNPGFLTDCAI